MKAKKKFDCVEMKNTIQARRHKEHEGLSDEEIRKRIERRLTASDDTVACKWRRIADHEKAAAKSA